MSAALPSSPNKAPMMSRVTEAFLTSFIGAAVAAYPIYRLLLAMKSRQTVSQFAPEGHQKKQGTPTMGGLIVLVGFLLVPGLQLLTQLRLQPSVLFRTDLSIFILFLGFAVIGFVDDFVVPRVFVGKRGLGWKQKILMQLFVAGFTAFSMYGDASIEAFGMVFFILFFSNAYNFSDGLDSLAALLLLGFAGGLFFLAKLLGQSGLCFYLMALVGAILPFLYLNKPKAKVFMGDVGSLPIGAVLGMVVAVLIYPRSGPGMNFTSPPLHHHNEFVGPNLWLVRLVCLLLASGMMIVELVPVPLQILSVKLRKKKLFSFTPIHHAFERKGWPEVKVVLVFAVCQLVLSVLACSIAAGFDSSGLHEAPVPTSSTIRFQSLKQETAGSSPSFPRLSHAVKVTASSQS